MGRRIELAGLFVEMVAERFQRLFAGLGPGLRRESAARRGLLAQAFGGGPLWARLG
jgi:hypothetical protein